MKHLGIRIRLKEILDEEKMTQKELSEKIKIRRAAISEICNNQRTTINRKHLDAIINYFNIEDISQLIVIINEKEKPNS